MDNLYIWELSEYSILYAVGKITDRILHMKCFSKIRKLYVNCDIFCDIIVDPIFVSKYSQNVAHIDMFIRIIIFVVVLIIIRLTCWESSGTQLVKLQTCKLDWLWELDDFDIIYESGVSEVNVFAPRPMPPG